MRCSSFASKPKQRRLRSLVSNLLRPELCPERRPSGSPHRLPPWDQVDMGMFNRLPCNFSTIRADIEACYSSISCENIGQLSDGSKRIGRGSVVTDPGSGRIGKMANKRSAPRKR
jgi:hypothetical protein